MRKLAGFAVPLCLGILAAQTLLPVSILPLCAAVCLAAALGFAFLLRRRAELRLRALLALTGLAAGLVWCAGYDAVVYDPVRALDSTTVRLEATVSDWPQQTDYGISVLAEVDAGGPLSVSAVIYADASFSDLQPGDKISTVASCRLAQFQRGEEVTYYTAKGVFLVATAYGEMTIDRPQSVPLRYRPAFLTRTLQEGIDAVFPDTERAGLVRALVTGDKSGLSDSFTAQLRRVGLSHVVVVSGMHLSILIWSVVSLLGPGRRRSAVVGCALVLLVMAMAGNTPSVIRAGILQIFLLTGPILGRRRDSLTTLSAALALLLLANPYAVANVSLQLSFGAVLGQYLFGSRLQGWLLERLHPGRHSSLPGRMWGALARLLAATLAATLSAQLFTAPLCAWYFGSISLISLCANVLALWAVTPAFLGGLAAGILSGPLPLLGKLAALIATPFLDWLQLVCAILSRAPFAAVTTGSVYYIAWFLFLYVLILLLLLRRPARPLFPVCGAVIGLCAAVLCTAVTFRSGGLTVTALDVGQGASTVIRGGGQVALVDCGGDSYENPGDIAADYLSDQGVTRLDLLVLTHYHEDHANGIVQLMRRLPVSVLAVPDVEPDSALRAEILAQAEAQGTQVWFIRDDYTLSQSELTFRLYAPLAEGDTNEEGLTVLCSLGGFDVLITGDMDSGTEQLLLQQAELPDIELLIVGHHGSKYSTSQQLLDTLRPEEAIISVSADNNYGHPTQETLDRLAASGTQVWRTDLNGTVTLRVGTDIA